MKPPGTHGTTAQKIREALNRKFPEPVGMVAEGTYSTAQVPAGKETVQNSFEYRDDLFSVALHEVPPEFLIRVVQDNLQKVVFDLSNIRHRLRVLGEHADPALGSITEAMATLAVAQAEVARIRLQDPPE